MHEYPKEELSTMIPYSKPKPGINQRSKNDNRSSNRMTNSTDVLDNSEDLVTHNDLEAFVSQIMSLFARSTATQPEYQILSATSKEEDILLLSLLPQGATIRSLADPLPSKPGTYHICEKANDKGSNKSRGIVKIFTATLTSLPDNYQFEHFLSNDNTEGNKAATPYSVSKNVRSSKVKALIDSRASSGIAGRADSRQMGPSSHLNQHVNANDVGEHTINDNHIAQFCAVSRSQHGDILCIYHEYTIGNIQERTIHSKIQILDYGNKVNDNAILLGGQQTFIAHGGHIFPLSLKNGIFYLEQRIPTDEEMRVLPQVIMT